MSKVSEKEFDKSNIDTKEANRFLTLWGDFGDRQSVGNLEVVEYEGGHTRIFLSNGRRFSFPGEPHNREVLKIGKKVKVCSLPNLPSLGLRVGEELVRWNGIWCG